MAENFGMIIQAKKVPSKEPHSDGQYDVQLFRNGEHIGTYLWWNPSKPDKRNKWLMFNCFKNKLEWID